LTSNTSLGGIPWKVVLSTLFQRVRSYRKTIYSSIVASPLVVENNNKHSAMRSCGKGIGAINIGRSKTSTVRKIEQLGKKKVPEPQRLPTASKLVCEINNRWNPRSVAKGGVG
jgi:hypothetical protein